MAGLIDLHACRTDSVATDIARLLGSLIADDRERWDAALEAYMEVRPMSLAERGLVEVYDRSGVLLSGATWLEWLFVEGRHFEDATRVAQRLNVAAARAS